MRGDANRLAQVVGNLLSNAIKYSPEGGTVGVIIGMTFFTGAQVGLSGYAALNQLGTAAFAGFVLFAGLGAVDAWAGFEVDFAAFAAFAALCGFAAGRDLWTVGDDDSASFAERVGAAARAFGAGADATTTPPWDQQAM